MSILEIDGLQQEMNTSDVLPVCNKTKTEATVCTSSKTGQKTIGEMLPGLMCLNFCGNILVVEPEFGMNR